MEIINGKNVSFHYVGTLDDGKKFDSSYDRGEPMSGVMGTGQLISGFENAMLGMKPNEKKSVMIESKDAYGERNPEAIQLVPLTSFPEDFEGIVGKVVQGKAENDQVFTAIITEVAEDNVTLDFNHPLAGKNLNFDIEIVSVSDAEAEVNTETADDTNE
jgi:peptidylprolyl isomerase